MYHFDTYWYISFTEFHSMHTTQRLDEETLDRIRKQGKMGDSFNLVLNKVLDEIDDLHDRLDAHEDEIDQIADNQAESNDTED